MILEVFAILTGISFLMILIGSIKSIDNPAFKTLGFFFLFLLSFTFINSTFEYQSGYTSLKSCNCSEFEQRSGTYTQEIIIYDYTTLSGAGDNSLTIGIFFAIGSAVGMILSFLDGVKRTIKK